MRYRANETGLYGHTCLACTLLRPLERTDLNWRNVERILDSHFADKRSEIVSIIFDRERSFWTKLRGELEEMKSSRGLNLSIHL